jgi:hypothetical protein
MHNKLSKAIAISAKVKSLIKAKVQIAEIINVTLVKDPYITLSLKKSTQEIEFEILMLRDIISRIVKGLPGYDQTRHLPIDYFSESDLKAGYVDLAMADIDTDYLDLSSGDIVSADNVPLEIRNLAEIFISEEIGVGHVPI